MCLVLSARRGINIQAPCIAGLTELEENIYYRVKKYFVEVDKKYGVGGYSFNECELPLYLYMGKYRFQNVSTNYRMINLTPDNPWFSKKTAYAMINANCQTDLETVDSLLQLLRMHWKQMKWQN